MFGSSQGEVLVQVELVRFDVVDDQIWEQVLYRHAPLDKEPKHQTRAGKWLTLSWWS